MNAEVERSEQLFRTIVIQFLRMDWSGRESQCGVQPPADRLPMLLWHIGDVCKELAGKEADPKSKVMLLHAASTFETLLAELRHPLFGQAAQAREELVATLPQSSRAFEGKFADMQARRERSLAMMHDVHTEEYRSRLHEAVDMLFGAIEGGHRGQGNAPEREAESRMPETRVDAGQGSGDHDQPGEA